MANFEFSKKKICSCKQIIEEIDDDTSEKYAILCNGRRFKKDSRKWLHKSTSRSMQLDSEEDHPLEACLDKNDIEDSCNGKNHTNKESFLQAFLESGLQYFPSTKPSKSCIRNVEENANSPEMFRRKNKRRLKSPSLGKTCVSFDDFVEDKLRNFIEMSHSFKPIRLDSSPDALVDSNRGSDSHFSSSNGNTNDVLWQNEVSRSSGIVTPMLHILFLVMRTQMLSFGRMR